MMYFLSKNRKEASLANEEYKINYFIWHHKASVKKIYKYLDKSFSVSLILQKAHRSRRVCNPPHTVAGLQTRQERCWKIYGQVLI